MHETLESIFLTMFLVGLLFAIVSAVLSGAFHQDFGQGSSFEHGDPGALGGHAGPVHGEGHAEVGWAQHDLATFSPLSPTILASFIAAAGGAGYIALATLDWSPWGAGLAALTAGFAFAAVVFTLFTLLFTKTQGTSTLVVAELVGTEAEVITNIPSGGTGEIAFVQRGQRANGPARAADGAAVARGAKVIVKDVSGPVYVVEETRESWLARTKSPQPGAPRT